MARLFDGYVILSFVDHQAIKPLSNQAIKRNASKTTFERLIHDRLAAELLRNGRPNYSLIFMVSTPMMVLETVDKQERSITPFIHYLKQELKTLSEFIGMPPTNTLIFEADNHFEALSLFKESTDAILNNLHFLDHTKKQTVINNLI